MVTDSDEWPSAEISINRSPPCVTWATSPERMTDAVTLSVPEIEVIGGSPQFDVTSVSRDRILAATCGDLR
jgi:hypothetical protein